MSGSAPQSQIWAVLHTASWCAGNTPAIRIRKAPPPVYPLSACPCLPAGFIVGFLAGILGVTGTGIGVNWNPADVSGSFSYGANWAWYQSNYE